MNEEQKLIDPKIEQELSDRKKTQEESKAAQDFGFGEPDKRPDLDPNVFEEEVDISEAKAYDED